MPFDSCSAELSSSEELLEDGDVSRESSILGSPDDREREWVLAAAQAQAKDAALPSLPRLLLGSGSGAGVRFPASLTPVSLWLALPLLTSAPRAPTRSN